MGNRKLRKTSRKEKAAERFGRLVPWMPAELPTDAQPFWPAKSEWPTSKEVEDFVRATRRKPDVRLAVLTGLRRYSEPASSQMVITIGSVFVSIAALAIGLSDFGLAVRIGMILAGALYVAMAIAGIEIASQMDERRKVAAGWLQAFESRL